MTSHTIRRNTTDETKPALVTKADIVTAPKPASIGDEYKFDLSPSANDRHDIIYFKWTVNKESQLPAGVRMLDRESDRDIDLRHQLDALRKGFDAALVAVGRKREGRVDTGEQLIESRDVALADGCFDLLECNGFVLIDIHAQRKPPRGKFDKEKFVLVCVFGRDNGDLVPFGKSPILEDEVDALASMTFQFLHVWSNPNGTMTWNFGSRADKPAVKLVDIQDGKLGVYPR